MPGLIHLRDSGDTLDIDAGAAVQNAGAWQDGSGNPQFLPTVLHVAWEPADLTEDESPVVLTIPGGSILIGAYIRVPCPSDTGVDSVIEVSDAIGLFDAGSISTSVDTWATALTSTSNQLLQTFNYPAPSVYEDDDVTIYYSAGLTPGTTTPVVYVDIVILPGVLS